MSQNKRLKKYLEENGSITGMEAWQELGIYRASARINDLRHSGCAIMTDMIKVTDRFGDEQRVARWILKSA